MPYGQEDNMDVFTGPMLKALKIQQYIKDRQFQDEQRTMLREKMRMDLDEEKRKRTQEDFNTALTLSSMGATNLQPGAIGHTQAAFGGGSAPITTPTGGRVSLPSPERQAQRQGTMKGIQETAESSAMEAEGRRSGRLVQVELPPLPGQTTAGEKVWIPREKIPDFIKSTRDIKAGKFSKSEFKTDPETGKTYFFAIDADTGEPIEKELGTQMSPKQPKGTEKDYEAEVLSKKDRSTERMRRIDEWMPWAYNQVSGESDPSTMLPEDKLKARKLAEETVDHAMKQEFEQEVARARVAGTSAKTQTKSTTGAAPRKWTIKRSDVPKAAKLKGMSVGDFMRAAAQNGGTITQ